MAKLTQAAEHLEESLDRFSHKVSEVDAKCRDTANKAKEKADELWSDFSDLIRKHPAQAVATAITAGILVGVLLRSSRKSPSNQA